MLRAHRTRRRIRFLADADAELPGVRGLKGLHTLIVGEALTGLRAYE